LCSGAFGQAILAGIPVGSEPVSADVNLLTNRIYVADDNAGSVAVVDGASGSLLATIATGEPFVLAVAVNSFTNRVYVTTFNNISSGNCFVKVIDGATNQIVDSIFISSGIGLGLQAVAIDARRNRIYVSDTNTTSVAVIDGNTGQVVTTVALPPSGNEPLGMAFNPQNRLLYVARNTGFGTVNVVDTKTDTLLAQPLTVGGFPYKIAVDPLLNRVYVTAFGGSFPASTGPGVYAVSGRTGKVVRFIDVQSSNPSNIAIDPVTRIAYVPNGFDGTIAVIDLARNKLVNTVPVIGGQLQGVAVDPLRNRVYVTDALNGRLYVLQGR
jgi:DNA-binding beta-propeller fold protein YncE